MTNDKEKNFISLIVYVHNSESFIGNFLKIMDEELNKNFKKYEVICVNDASIDKSLSIIQDYASSQARGIISVINMSYYQGIESSMNAGIDLAIGDFIFEFDTAIIDYDPLILMDTYRRALEGYDIVSVVPEKNRDGASSIFYLLYNTVSNSKNKLRTETFRIVSRRGINRIRSINKNILYRKPVYANCGLPKDCLTYEANENSIKDIRKNNEKRFDSAINSLILFTDIAYRISAWFAILMMLGAACGGAYVVKVYFSNSKPVAGWTTTMMFLTLCFCAVFALLAVVIKYLSIILNMIFHRQNYLINSIEKYGN